MAGSQSKEETLRFVRDYKDCPELWDVQHPSYRNKNVRVHSLATLGGKYGLSVEGVKNKIKSLRSYFAKEHAKVKNRKYGSRTDSAYVSSWFAYGDLSFILDGVAPNLTPQELCETYLEEEGEESTSSCVNSQDLDSAGQDTSSCKATNASQQLSDRLQQQSADVEDDEATSPGNTENSSAATTTKMGGNSQHSQKIRKRALYTSVSVIHGAAKRRKQMSDDSNQYPNEFDLFCETLAIQLKKMPLHRALICQEKLQSVMTQERLSQLSQSYPSITSTYQQALDSEKYSMTTPSPDPSIHSESD